MESNGTNNNLNSVHFAYPLLNYVSASMFGNIFDMKIFVLFFFFFFSYAGSSNSSSSIASSTPRHYVACSYFVSQYQTVRSLAEELDAKFGVSLDEMRLWMRFNEVRKLCYRRTNKIFLVNEDRFFMLCPLHSNEILDNKL